ncbi:unnamed protein product, partial [marine sediment metagenome]
MAVGTIANTFDYNPAHAIWHILNTMLGLPTSRMDSTSFLAAATTLYNEDRGISILFSKQDKAIDYIASILNHINGILYYGDDAKFHLILIRDDYIVGDLPIIGAAAITDEPKVVRGAWNTTENQVKVQYSQRLLYIDTRITQEAIEVLRPGAPFGRITQEAIEVLRKGIP